MGYRKSHKKHPKMRKHHTRVHRRKTKSRYSRKHNKKTRRVQRGGYGKGACPFAGKQWNASNGGNFFKLGTPIGVGGTPPYPGTVSPSPQHPFRSNYGLVGGRRRYHQRGGAKCNGNGNGSGSGGVASSASTFPYPQPLVNAYRITLGGAENLYNQFQGIRPSPDPRPWSQHEQQV
jgi:hypothetical protein